MFKGTNIKPFQKKVWLASPLIHGEEMKYVTQAYDTNWMSTIGDYFDPHYKLKNYDKEV